MCQRDADEIEGHGQDRERSEKFQKKQKPVDEAGTRLLRELGKCWTFCELELGDLTETQCLKAKHLELRARDLEVGMNRHKARRAARTALAMGSLDGDANRDASADVRASSRDRVCFHFLESDSGLSSNFLVHQIQSSTTVTVTVHSASSSVSRDIYSSNIIRIVSRTFHPGVPVSTQLLRDFL